MNKSSRKSLFVVLVALLFGTALAVYPSDGSPNAAIASEPEDHTPWSTPANVSQSPSYDNLPSLGASPNGAATVFWPRAAGDAGIMMQASNVGLGLPFVPQVVQVGEVDLNGGNRVAGDRIGRRHLVWWDWAGSFKDYYARIGTNGLLEGPPQMVPGSDDGTPRKLTGVAVDQALNVHMVFARSNVPNSLVYYVRNEAGQYIVYKENIPTICGPFDIGVEVSSLGEVMVSWKDCAQSGQGSDIYTARRVAPNNWLVENISAACCSYCPGASGAYLPELAATRDGGFRASWSDGRCAGFEPDIYYREWVPGTGWDNRPIVRVSINNGQSYYNTIAVDDEGTAHILWADDTSSPFAYYRTFYVHGRDTVFSGVTLPFAQWAGGAWTREVSGDYGGDAVQVAFATNYGDPLKENYFSFNVVGGGTPTATPTSTNTPTPEPPPCGDEPFNDVCPEHWYYAPIMALSQNGILNGYNSSPPCPNNLWVPCFLPNNGATRAQMAKIVSLAANLPSGGTNQAFTDVPPTNTFFPFVQSAYAAGVISGYPCGGQGEPCDSQNRPYFRPGAGVTRGQTAKMVATAFGFNDPVPNGVWSFQDVPPGSTFNLFVERMVMRHILSGYICGGVGEPCVPPLNRPYFRPNAPVTRAQTAKIVDASSTQASATVTNTPEPTATVELTATATIEATSTATMEPTATAATGSVSPDR